MKTTTRDGYHSRLRCGKYHSGNHRLYGTPGSWYQCAGCGQLIPWSQIERDNRLAREGKLVGEMGCGRVVAV